MASTYEHQPLKSSRAIRVLTLEPAKSPESIIKCSLGELDLDNITRSTRYEALSYVWGARKGTIPILCEGKEILVTPNCHDAMLQLRLRSKQRRLFIDAICIDQRPDTPSRREREGQVKIMGIVYERASRVIVWLDKIQPPSEQRLFRFIRIFAWIGRLEAKVRPGRSFLDGPIPGAVSWCFFNRKNAAANVQVCLSVVINPWFKRVWTLQESTLPNKARCVAMFGAQEVNYSLMLQSLFFLIGRLYSVEDEMSYPIFWRAILSYSIASNSKTDEPYSGDLAALMWRGACALESTLPQDRMFGLYGVMNKVKIEVPEPDYTRSEVEVCEMTTVAIIRTTNALDILPSCVQLNYSASYPSWVLGSSNTSSDWLSLELITGAAKDKVYGASCGTKATYSLIYGPGRLAVRGLILSKVKFLRVSDVLGTHSTHGVEQELPYWSYIKACQSWCQYVATHFGFEDISHAAIRILTNDHHKMKEIRIHDYDESSGKVEFTSFQGWFDLMLYPYCLIHYPEDLLMMSREESRLQNPGSSDCVVPLLFYAMAKKKRNGPVAEQIAMTILKHANYALMVLESGHFARGLGICKEGDVVALLAASSFPVALRHVQGNESRFVSQIYVDGIMDGEGWPENESELEEIVLV